MPEGASQFSEHDLRQVFCDQQARMEVGSLASQRVASIHRLIAKIQSLNDSEFDAAFKVFESIIEQAQHKKQAAHTSNTKKESPEQILQAALKSANQNQKKK